MQWQIEWLNSLTWIGRTFLLAAAGFAIVVIGLTRFTRWGRQVRTLAWAYFSPRRSWRPLAAFALILLLAIAAVRLNVLLSYWNKGFYDSIQALDPSAFWFFMRLFGVLATLNVARVLLAYYVSQAFEIRWRTWLNDRFTENWFAGSAYYRTQFLDQPIDNPDQRVQVDIGTFVTYSRTLAIGAVDAVVSLIEFSIILWSLSAPLLLMGIEVPRAMVFLVYFYVIAATLVAFRLGRPLIALNFNSEKFAADFRYGLIRVREYAENIAFYRGESVERAALAGRFASFIRNLWSIVFRSMKFEGFNLAISQGAVVFPFLLQAPRFFSGAIKLGAVMQTSQAFGQVQEALSFFRLSYDTFAQYRAALDRLTGFLQATDASRSLPRITVEESVDQLQIDGLDVQRPDGTALVNGLALQLSPGQAMLVQGGSGVGKTTLLRAVAGLWPFADGVVSSPKPADSIFLPQRPYLPLGNLRAALAYPSPEADEMRLKEVLARVHLAPLTEHLNEDRDWSRVLSLGEQQRLAFARLLLHRPRIAYLDEATSATDEGLEHSLYALLRDELPGCILVSVAHRSTLDPFHTHRLELQGAGRWRFGPWGHVGCLCR